MALSSWRASIVQSIRVARGFLWLIASKRSLTSRESWPQTQASFKSRFHKVLWISLVVSPVLYCSYLCINQGPWFASLHICPPHFKAMQDLFVSVDESPWMWDTEKHVNICQLHTGGGEQTEQWYCFFFWRVVQFIDVVAVFCCCLRCSGHSFGMGERLKMLDQRHARALLSRVACIPPDSKLRRCSKRSHWKPVKTAADSGCLLSGLRTGSLMTRLWPKTYLNGACTTLPLLAARKSEKVWLMPDWRKTWSDSRLAWLCRLIPLVKNSNFQFKSIYFDLQLWLWSVLSIAGWNARVYIVVICGEE